MDWTSRICRLNFVFLLTLLLATGVVVGEDRTSESLDANDSGIHSFIDYIFGTDRSGSQRTEKSTAVGRTFGHKRIQFMLMPMMYKMGVIMTMLAVLIVISLKGLMIGMTLLVLKLSAIFGKFYASWSHGSHSVGAWSPPSPPIHVHLHNSGGGGGWSPHMQPAYGGWDVGAANGPPDQHYYYKG